MMGGDGDSESGSSRWGHLGNDGKGDDEGLEQ